MIIACENVSIQLGGRTILDGVSFRIEDQENWAITGDSGSGKSILAKAINHQIFFRGKVNFISKDRKMLSPHIVLIEQQHEFKNNSNVSNFYYQQRFNSCDSDDALTLEEELTKFSKGIIYPFIELLGLQPLLQKPLIQLSNGENKRLQLAKALMQEPELLILDNPFTGLDIKGRGLLKDIIQQLIEKGIRIILIAPLSEIPEYFDKIVVLKQGKLDGIFSVGDLTFPVTPLKSSKEILSQNQVDTIRKVYALQTFPFNEVVRMERVNIAYNGKSILSDINWIITKGERWAVAGPNGAGKSTLLSLITADNPQAYANDIWLFERKRGSGESKSGSPPTR